MLTTLDYLRQLATLRALDASYLTGLLNAASTRCERYCRRSFASVEAAEVYNGDGTNSLMLRRIPVTAVKELVISLPASETVTYTGTQLLIDSRTGEIRVKAEQVQTSQYYCFPRAFQNISVTYTAGFATIPSDLQEACRHMVQWLHTELTRNPAIKQERLGDYTVTYADPRMARSTDNAGAQDLPAVVKQLLSSYVLVQV